MSGPIIAVDVGNSRAKFGLFRRSSAGRLPEPESTFIVSRQSWAADGMTCPKVFENLGRAQWWIASVNRPFSAQISEWIRSKHSDSSITLLDHTRIPLKVDVEHPERVGVDRLAGAVAANRLRSADKGAISIDIGSAITIDLISSEGVFRGGAILPGVGMAAKALHQFTDLLPQLAVEDLAVGQPSSGFAQAQPAALGRSTVEAMQAGLFWGAIGAMKELIAQLRGYEAADTAIFLTGGTAPAVASLLGSEVAHVPNLVLSGIAAIAQHSRGA